MKKKKLILILFFAVLFLGTAFYLIKSKTTSEVTPAGDTLEKNLKVNDSAEIEKVPSAPAEAKDSIQEEFVDVMNELPTAGDLQNLDKEELHHTPEIVLEGGMMVGRLIEKAETDLKRREPTLGFLKSCAENAEVLPQIRAVCWKKTLSLIPEWKIFLPIADAKVPEDIRTLASQLP